MNKAAPWSIEGIDFDAREAAREAARRDGLSLGEWMNRAIADRAAEIGADAEGFNADERLEAVAAQLARLSREMEPHGPPRRESLRASAQDERAEEFSAAARPKEADRVRLGVRPAGPRFQPAAPPRPRLAGGREGAGAEALLEQAVAAFQQQAGARFFRRAARRAQRSAADQRSAGLGGGSVAAARAGGGRRGRGPRRRPQWWAGGGLAWSGAGA